jgi:hypothetical protein
VAADLTREQWLHAFCERIGVQPPSAEEIDVLLELAATAAHDSERPAAPLACWAAGRSGRSLSELREIARQINPA